MTQEDKNLLLKYLCMALPYGVKVESLWIEKLTDVDGYEGKLTTTTIELFINNEVIVKPYLRPMSSMTDEEKEQLKTLYDAENVTNESICFLEGGTLEEYEAETSFVFCYCVVEWLLEHHFDFIGLISKGLAIEVTKDNNPYKE